jgi:hypothetical protein
MKLGENMSQLARELGCTVPLCTHGSASWGISLTATGAAGDRTGGING